MNLTRAATVVRVLMLTGAGALLGVLLVPFFLLFTSKRGDAYETRTLASGPIELRLTAYHEDYDGFGPPGAFWGFDARPRGSEAWAPVLECIKDNSPALPRVGIGSLGPSRAWFYFEHHLATTSDGGQSWQLWELRKELPGESAYGWIEEVTLSEKGNGFMRLQSLDGNEPIAFWTEDFGRTWKR